MIDLDKILDEVPQNIKWKHGNIPVSYVSVGVDINIDDKFPSYFCCKPDIGDLVESTMGRRLAIKGFIHTVDNNEAILKIILGKDTGGETEESAGVIPEVDW